MPLIKIQASVSTPPSATVETILKALSTKLAKHLGKPESYVMTVFEPNVKMSFGGTFDPVCYIEIKSVGSMSPTLTKSMSQEFCQIIQDTLSIPQDRIYIEFNDAQGAMWGWNGGTFA